MKMKLFMAAAVAAGCSLANASISSANVVGYMEKSIDTASGYTWIANTFEKVDGSTVHLSDFSIKEAQLPTAVYLYIMDSKGCTAVNGSGDKMVFRYVHPDKCTTSNNWVPGWYFNKAGTTSASGTEYKKGTASVCWAGNVEIPFGLGFGMYKADVTANLLFSGAVKNTDAEIPITVASGYTWTGNVMPSDCKLSDILIKEAQLPTAVYLYIMDSKGCTAVNGSGDKMVFRYVHPDKCTTSNNWVPGWYFNKAGTTSAGGTEYKKGTSSACWAGNVEIKAGAGFGMYKADVTATLVIPTPLQ